MIADLHKISRRFALALAMTATVAGGVQAKEPGADDPRIQLLEAVLADNAGQVQDLLVAGVNPNIKEADRGPAVVMAASLKSYRAMAELIAAPHTNLEATNRTGDTALMVVSAHGDIPAVKALLARGAKVNRDPAAPLHAAARAGHADVVNLLIEKKADLNAADQSGMTPMMLAARYGHFSAYEAIVKAGADPTARNKKNQTAADLLEARGEVDRARLLRRYMKKYQAANG